MVNIKINNKDYSFPQDYKDVNLGRFKQIQDYLYSDLNKDITETLTDPKKKVKRKDEEKVLNYYINLINYITNIPVKELKQVKPYSKEDDIGDVSIQGIFDMMSFLLYMPNIENPKPMETIGRFHFIDKIDLTQAILKDAQMIDYTEIQAVTKAFNKLEEGRYEYLGMMLSIMYRPMVRENWYRKPKIEEYDYDKRMEREEWFDGVSMDIVWNALFFFTQLKVNYLKSIKLSLKEAVDSRAQG